MNTVKNDYGEVVTAVGAPGSLERLQVERPALIAQLNQTDNFSYGCAIDEAIELIRANGIRSELETTHLLKLSRHGRGRGGDS